MPIVPQWSDDSKTCIIINYQGRWTWDEFQDAAHITNGLMKSVDYSIVLIHNTLQGSTLPKGNILAQGTTAISGFEHNLLLIVVVVNSTLIRTFVNIAASLNPGGRGNIIKTVSTLEAAMSIAEKTIANPA